MTDAPQSWPMLDRALLPSADAVWSWVEELNRFGPRLTGSAAHNRSIDFIEAQMRALGLTVQRDQRHLLRWEPVRCALSVNGSSELQLNVASPFPYSGRTNAHGVTGELAWLGASPLSYDSARGKIAVVEVRARRMTPLLRMILARRDAAMPPDADVLRPERGPLLSGLACAPDLGRALQAGALGVICVWRGCADEDASGQWLPFTTPYRGCPALWVGATAGEALRAAHRRGDTVNLVLEATVEERVPTDTIYAVLPGSEAGETIIVNTHSDGPNAAEENGAAGVLALASYCASLPRKSLRRTIIFVVCTGHFQLAQLGAGGQATKAWLDRHHELWDGQPGHQRAIAGLTLEHLGCLEWKEDEDGSSYAATGRLERELVYATNLAMQAVYRASVADRTKMRSLVVEPRVGIVFGEGEPLFDYGIPSISLCPLPNYLCATLRDGGIDRLDRDFMHQQIMTFAKALIRIDAMATASIGKVDRSLGNSFGMFMRSKLSGFACR